VLGGELAVPQNPKSAHAGSNVLWRALIRDVSNHSWGGDGPHVTDAYEPRQVREEAAVSKKVCVVTESISDLPVVRMCRTWFEEGCTAKDSSRNAFIRPFEPVSKGSILIKVKKDENFNHRNIYPIFRGLKFESDAEIGPKGAF